MFCIRFDATPVKCAGWRSKAAVAPHPAALHAGYLLPLLLFLASCAAPPAPTVTVAPPVAPFAVSKWEMLPDWQATDLLPSWPAFLQSCRALKNKPGWQVACLRAGELAQPDNAALRAFFEEQFTPYQVFNPDGSPQGLVTGYYEPKLTGSRVMTERFRYPLYAAPDDLLIIDLGEVYPQLKDLRLRGRLQGNRVVPYYNRAEIDGGKAALQGRELFWVDNAVELFFLQIQGSGRIDLPDGSLVKVGYAEQNGHPYISIGRKLVEMGEAAVLRKTISRLTDPLRKRLLHGDDGGPEASTPPIDPGEGRTDPGRIRQPPHLLRRLLEPVDQEQVPQACRGRLRQLRLPRGFGAGERDGGGRGGGPAGHELVAGAEAVIGVLVAQHGLPEEVIRPVGLPQLEARAGGPVEEAGGRRARWT